MLGLELGIWVLLATTRLLRGEEDTGRAELVLPARVSAPRVVAVQLLVLAGSVLLVGRRGRGCARRFGAPLPSSVLYGLGLAGLTGTLGGLALGLFFVVRMAANSADSRGWLRWLTPYGWVDELHAFGGDRWAALLPLLAAPLLLGAGAVVLRRRRDSGAGLLALSDRHRGRPWLLGSAPGLAWRTNQGGGHVFVTSTPVRWSGSGSDSGAPDRRGAGGWAALPRRRLPPTEASCPRWEAGRCAPRGRRRGSWRLGRGRAA